MTKILVLGGTGKTGRRVVRQLTAAGARPVAAARTDGTADVRLDLDDPATWATALAGASGAYLVEPGVPMDADQRSRIPRFVAAAAEAGVRRFVLLTAPRAGEEEHPLHQAEQAVRDSGAEWTVLRPTWFAQNFSEGPWRTGVTGGMLALPTGEGRVPFLDADDIAETAAAALTDAGSRHAGRTYLLTGPEALGVGEALGIVGRASGRAVRHVDLDPEAFAAQQVEHGVPPRVARFLTALLVEVRDGLGGEPTGDVEQALGRPARSFRDYAAAAAAAGAWR